MPKVQAQPPEPSPPQSSSFLERLKDVEGSKTKRLLGYYVATQLVKPGDGIVVLSGTTPCLVAEQIISAVEDVSLFTNSIPVLWVAMKLSEANLVARGVTLRLLGGGETHLLTGLVCNSSFRSFRGEKLIYSPHSLTARGIEGNRDISYIQAGLAAAQEIILPITDDKLNRRADVVIKHFGHIAKESSKQKRHYTIVLPYRPSTVENQEPASSILAAYRDVGVKVIRLPRDFAIPQQASDIFSPKS